MSKFFNDLVQDIKQKLKAEGITNYKDSFYVYYAYTGRCQPDKAIDSELIFKACQQVSREYMSEV